MLPRLVAYAVGGAALFYGGSVAAAKQVPAYRSFFQDHVYGGDALIKYFDTHELSDLPEELKHMDVEKQVTRAASQVRHGFQRVSDYVTHNEHVQHTREEVEKRTAELQTKLQDQLEELRAKAGEESAHLLDKAQSLAGKSYSEAREHMNKAVDDAREHIEHATANLTGHPVTEKVVKATTGIQPPPGPPEYGATYRERKLVAPTDNHGARLRPDPSAPVLPRLTTSVKKMSSSEPVIAQLASTIDELTAFVKETPHSGALARGVLESAEADLAQLSKRLDEIKASDAAKLEKQLAKQAETYEDELKKAAEKATNEQGQRDKDWAAQVSRLQDEQAAQFKTRLAKELETQSEIIDQRLKEEVIARGIELQRKWTSEIKAQVERERAGRLARLDELAKDLHQVEELSKVNAQTLDDNIGVHALNGAVRVLRSAIDGENAAESAYTRRTFANELAGLRAARKAQDNDVIASALHAIEQNGAAEAGVESLPTLHEWFSTRVAPRLTSVALMPEQGAGVLSYVASYLMSPFLFVRKGNVPGSDVASTVARADWFLERRDLDSATRELNQLRGWAKILVSDWLTAARLRLEVDQALDMIDKEAAFASMLHT